MESSTIIRDTTKFVKRFGVKGRVLEFKIKPIPKGTDPVSWIKKSLNEIILKCTEHIKPSDYLGFTFCSANYASGDAYFRFKKASEVTVEDVWNTIGSIYQSNASGFNTETFCLGVTIESLPQGTGRGRRFNTFTEESLARRGIIAIKNTDSLCLSRALCVAKARIDKNPHFPKLRDGRGKLQGELAQELMKAAGVSIGPEGAGISELQKFQQHLVGYKITVYAYNSKGRDVIFQGGSEGLPLNLVHHKGHYNVVTSLTSAFCCGYYCEICHIPYDHKSHQRCSVACPACRNTPVCEKNVVSKVCSICKRSFRGSVCFGNHLSNGTCSRIRRCEECFKIVPTSRKHFCNEIFCKICYKHHNNEHLCFIQPDTRSPPLKDLLIVFYDFETSQETERDTVAFNVDTNQEEIKTVYVHEPTLCVFKQFCDKCINSSEPVCLRCGVRQHILKADPVSRFTEFVLNQRKIFKSVVAIAHNFGGFDGQFVLRYVMNKTDITPELIMRGTKIICMIVGNVRFLDSLNYFNMALSKLPEAFGFTELKKGYFPYLFIKKENSNYVGPIPALNYYEPDSLKSEKSKKELLLWHAEKLTENYVFDYQKELVEYCVSDVDILSKACLNFRDMMLQETIVCPFLESCTIASTCNKVFRRNFLKPNTIGIIPKKGYRNRDTQSEIAIRWLVLEERQREITIQHASRGFESRIGGMRVDGYCETTNQVFEFQGCYYHGCTTCFIGDRNTPLKDDPSQTFNTRYEATQSKMTE